MKKIFFTLSIVMAFLTGYTQMTNSGYVTVENGATLVIEGDYTSTGTGSIEIDGDVVLKGDFVNNGGDIASGSTGDLVFNGTSSQEITGTQSTTFYCGVEVDNSAGVALTNTQTGNHQTLGGTMTLTDGMVTLNNFDLTMSSSGISGASSSKFVVTNGTGRLIGTVPTSGSMTYPVGYGTVAANYAPVTLANADVEDVFAVQVKDDLLDNCGSGSAITDDVVTMRWDIDPSGGSATEADVTLNWDSSQEDGTFDNTDCSVIHCDAGEYTAVGGYGDGSSYSITGTDITDFSWFGVGGSAFGSIFVDAKIFLQGPWNGTNMNTTLRTNSLVPTDQPYDNVDYVGTHLEYAGAESNSSLPTNVVDWVLIELRTGTAANTSIGKVAALLLNDGTIASYENGTSVVPFKGLAPGSYYLAIHHRNHFSVLTSSTISLSRTSTSLYDFSTAQSQAYQDGGIATNAAMADVSGGGVYGMWRGDVNFDHSIKYNGGSNDRTEVLNVVGVSTPANIITGAYAEADVNMDSEVKYNGSSADRTEILNVVGVSTPAEIYSSHVPY